MVEHGVNSTRKQKSFYLTAFGIYLSYWSAAGFHIGAICNNFRDGCRQPGRINHRPLYLPVRQRNVPI